MDTIGVITSTVTDAALVLDVMGRDPLVSSEASHPIAAGLDSTSLRRVPAATLPVMYPRLANDNNTANKGRSRAWSAVSLLEQVEQGSLQSLRGVTVGVPRECHPAGLS